MFAVLVSLLVSFGAEMHQKRSLSSLNNPCASGFDGGAEQGSVRLSRSPEAVGL